MNDQERMSLQRDLSDALAALPQNKPVPTLAGLADHLVKVGSPFRFHSSLIRGALARQGCRRDHRAVDPGPRQARACREVETRGT
jgi:hypothetical protein